MKCSGCSAKIDQVFMKLPDLRSWQFSLGNAEYNLEVESIGATSDDIIKAVTDAGYTCQLSVSN
jgi:copper chaperone CopZ